MGVTFSIASGLNDSVFGMHQHPIQKAIEANYEACENSSMLKSVFSMNKSNTATATFTGMTAMDGFRPVGENGAYPKDSMQEGYRKTIMFETWKDSFPITKEAVKFAQLFDMKTKPKQFVQGYHRAREEFGAAVFGGAIAGNTSLSYAGRTFDIAGADALAVFATNHAGKVSGKTQSNKFSNEFSVDALGKAEEAMHLFKGENDELLAVAPDTILIPDDAVLKRAVFAAVGSEKDPETANNAFNMQCGRWNVIIWPYLNRYVASGVKPWILIDSNFNADYSGAVWMDFGDMEVSSSIDNNTGANVWHGDAWFNASFNNWRFAAVGGITGGTDL